MSPCPVLPQLLPFESSQSLKRVKYISPDLDNSPTSFSTSSSHRPPSTNMPSPLPPGAIRPPPNMVVFGPKANCTLELCPVEMSVYGYRPSLAANIVFIALYTLSMAIHLYLGLRWKHWWYMGCMLVGGANAIVGYVGRVMLHYNPFSFVAFMIQISECGGQFPRDRQHGHVTNQPYFPSLRHKRTRLLLRGHLRHSFHGVSPFSSPPSQPPLFPTPPKTNPAPPLQNNRPLPHPQPLPSNALLLHLHPVRPPLARPARRRRRPLDHLVRLQRPGRQPRAGRAQPAGVHHPAVLWFFCGFFGQVFPGGGLAV